MPLDAQIIDSMTGEIDPELSAQLDAEQHAALFAQIGQQPSRFPLLMRMRDYFADAEYTTDELEPLIAEVEQTADLFASDSHVYRFTGPFHSVCCLAFLRKKSVVLQAD